MMMMRRSLGALLVLAVCCCCSLVTAEQKTSVGKGSAALELPPDVKELLGGALNTAMRAKREFCERTRHCVEKKDVRQDELETRGVLKRLDTVVVAFINALKEEWGRDRRRKTDSSSAEAAALASETASLNAARNAVRILQSGGEGGSTNKEVLRQAAEQAAIALEEAQKSLLYAEKVAREQGTSEATERAKAVQNVARNVDMSLTSLLQKLEKGTLKGSDMGGRRDALMSNDAQGAGGAARFRNGNSVNVTKKLQELASAVDGSVPPRLCLPVWLLLMMGVVACAAV
ncbi:hypothetical protein TraAM80_08380 [Trypanosoma rangeli]|uniref:Surface protein TolT n=1 Tax=Trypanosoma rangeli TaxID=5698 RepID=A0A3R7JZK2_TRYRA|nr:uncharacterized protein TraAM80_08380 [Trypanosoma rangeli]RNE99378.1 hypothetical protein TraAM80_08380 [Trypanosoma rangeli]|eukprot:RNE99378.1 hypothetical protein TraAM80_08380 [Trypanosoma rangeli]